VILKENSGTMKSLYLLSPQMGKIVKKEEVLQGGHDEITLWGSGRRGLRSKSSTIGGPESR